MSKQKVTVTDTSIMSGVTSDPRRAICEYIWNGFDDGNEAVCDDVNMNLYAHSILGFSPKSFNLEVLLNPFEKQLHLPPIFIKESDVLGCKIEIIRVVNKAPLEFRGIVDNPSDDSGILLLILLLGKAYALVFEDVVSPIKYAFSIELTSCTLALVIL